MESAYAMANIALAEIRKKNADELKNREREVREKAPEYADIEARLAAGGLALAKCVLNGTSDISEIRRHTEKAQADKAMILKRLNLPENYLDEIYNCEKCRDTGFDENGRSKLYFFNTCEAIIRTMPLMMFDEHIPEDLDSDLEDHMLDATRYFCMLRQVAPARVDHNRTAIANDPLSDDNLKKANNASTAPWRR